jgi:hypothetical protein
MTDSEKLRALATWFDITDAMKNKQLFDNEVQIDLRAIANRIEQSHKPVVMQAEGSDGVSGAAVASSAVGSQTSAWQCPNCRFYTTNENYEKFCSQSCFDGA